MKGDIAARERDIFSTEMNLISSVEPFMLDGGEVNCNAPESYFDYVNSLLSLENVTAAFYFFQEYLNRQDINNCANTI